MTLALVVTPIYVLLATAQFATALVLVVRRARPAHGRVRVRARLPPARAPARALRRGRRRRDLARSARAAAAGRSPVCSPCGARSSPRAQCCSCREPPAMPRRPRRGPLSLAARLVPPRLGLALDRRPHRPARALAQPSGGAAHRRPRRLGAALLERRLRLRARPARLRRRCGRDPPPHAHVAVADRVRQGDPRQSRPAARSDACRLRRTSCAQSHRSAATRTPPSSCAGSSRRGRARHRGDRRGRRPLEPASAAEGAREPRRSCRARPAPAR